MELLVLREVRRDAGATGKRGRTDEREESRATHSLHDGSSSAVSSPDASSTGGSLTGAISTRAASTGASATGGLTIGALTGTATPSAPPGTASCMVIGAAGVSVTTTNQ